jgi:hypothetical protein
MKQSAPFLRQVQVLTSRTLLTTIRDPFGLVGSWSEAVFMGLVCGLIFYQIPHNLAGIRSTQAAFYLLTVGHSYLFTLFEIYRLTRVDIHSSIENEGKTWSPASLGSSVVVSHMESSKTSSSRSCFVHLLLSRRIPRRHRIFLASRGVDSLCRGQLRVVLCRVAEGFLVGSSDGEPVCYGADLRFGFLCTSSDYSGIRSMDEIYFLLCELRFFESRP